MSWNYPDGMSRTDLIHVGELSWRLDEVIDEFPDAIYETIVDNDPEATECTDEDVICTIDDAYGLKVPPEVIEDLIAKVNRMLAARHQK